MVHIAHATPNFVQNEHSKGSALFLVFGRDAYLPLTQLLNPKFRYMGDDKSLSDLDILRYIHALTICNI